MRRSRSRIGLPALCLEKGEKGKGAGELRRRHHIGADGTYRGVSYFQTKSPEAELEEDEN